MSISKYCAFSVAITWLVYLWSSILWLQYELKRRYTDEEVEEKKIVEAKTVLSIGALYISLCYLHDSNIRYVFGSVYFSRTPRHLSFSPFFITFNFSFYFFTFIDFSLFSVDFSAFNFLDTSKLWHSNRISNYNNKMAKENT